MRTYILLVITYTLFVNLANAQISPPGLGKARTANWLAIGLRQKFPAADAQHWQSMSYIGMGRKSNPDNYDLIEKPAIWVISQEISRTIKTKWNVSVAASYRQKDQYHVDAPYYHDLPYYHQEWRGSSRISYTFINTPFQITPTLRQELRIFDAPGASNVDENWQLRTRLSLKLSSYLDKKHRHQLNLSSEQLFASSKFTTSNWWSRFSYRESRFLLFYTFKPTSLPLTASIGYMCDAVAAKKAYQVHYLACDIVIDNPFRLGH